jgi:GT2 family glycosyltransferase/glycosyltransferase involved in cell wall biosynthesis
VSMKNQEVTVSILNPLNHPVLFSNPSRLAEPGAWVEHIPFAMYLVSVLRPKIIVELGTQTGNSYCAFCQAVKELNIITSCYAIDTWRGDDQAGYYGDEVLNELRKHHDPLYGNFSRLVQSTFDGAVKEFSDHSIDLLHIDGFHTYEAVKHDFETWLPKLSDRAVVLFHDISVRERDFGVWQFWEDLYLKYPSFSMTHGNGLGVLAVGKQYNQVINALMGMGEKEIMIFREYFFYLGKKLTVQLEHEQSVKALTAQITEKDQAMQILMSRVAEKEQSVQELASHLAKNDQSVHELTADLAKKDQFVQELASQLAKNDQSVQELTTHLAKKDQFVQELTAQLAKKDRAVKLLTTQVNKLKESIQIISTEITERERSLQALMDQVAEKEQSMLALTARIYASEQSLEEIKTSKAWKIALLFRRIRILLIPPSSLRARILGRFVKVIFPFKKVKQNGNSVEDISLVRSSNIFDESWYLANYTDVAQAKVDPLLHYLSYGGFEGRDPGPNFSSSWYLNEYADAKKSGINPLIHYLRKGKEEGRSIKPFKVSADLDVTTSSGLLDGEGKKLKNPPSSFDNHIRVMSSRFIKLVRLPFGLFKESNRVAIKYTLKNYGLLSLVKIVLKKMKNTFLGVEDATRRIMLDETVFTTNSYLDKESNKWTEDNYKSNLGTFLRSNTLMEFPISVQPMVSIILLFYNRAEISLQCLETLLKNTDDVSYELIIVDNASTDETSALLDHVKNAKVFRNIKNAGFGGGCNQAAEHAIGKYLLFLNNDAQLLPNSLKVMLDTFNEGNGIGAVGGKLIYPNGRLQEAGSIIWQDGSCKGYGRNDDPFKPEYCYLRDVDYCSGALLLTPRELFFSMGKFDPAYAPAYYEDADYCLQLWEKGYRVVYQPFAVAVHHEFGSRGKEDSIELQIKNQNKFNKKWQNFLYKLYPNAPQNLIYSRNHTKVLERILFVDDQIPDYTLGSGLPRTYLILKTLAEMGYRLTFLPLQIPDFVPEITKSLEMKGIEVLYGKPGQKINIEEFLRLRPGYYDVIFVSRPHNMQEMKAYLGNYASHAMIIYDAEALFSLRSVKLKELIGERVTQAEKERLIQAEVALAKEANIVATVSALEKEQFEKYGAPCVHILGHVVKPNLTPAPFEERQDILFVGGILGSPSPNEDSVLYFVDQIFPLVRREVNCEFLIVGTNLVKGIWELESDHVHVIGKVEDLTPYYNRCRLFVVPTRFSAGISLKMIEAAAYGLPAVVTPLTANQLGWQEDRDILIGHNPRDFADKVVALYSNRDLFYSLRKNALARICLEYSPEKFVGELECILGQSAEFRHH